MCLLYFSCAIDVLYCSAMRFDRGIESCVSVAALLGSVEQGRDAEK